MGSTIFPSDRVPDLMEFACIAGAAQDMGTLRSGTLPLIRRIFQSDSTIFWLTDQDERAIKPLEVNVQQRFFPMYRDYFYKMNPFDPVNMESFKGTALSMEQIVPYKEFKNTEYYNDFIRPQKIQRQMVVYVRVNGRLTSLLCTHRAMDRKFDKRDLAAGDMISKHLATAIDRIRLFEKVKRTGSFFQMIVEGADMGIAVLNMEMKKLFMNSNAASLCAGIKTGENPRSQRHCTDSDIPRAVLKDCEALRQGVKSDVQEGLEPSPVKERILLLSSFEKYLFRSRIADGILTDFNQPLFLITMERLPSHQEIKDRAARGDWNLTKRESEIVSHIFKGYRNAEIAERLFISEGTVKNHLRNIFEKVRVKNRTGLIHKVFSH